MSHPVHVFTVEAVRAALREDNEGLLEVVAGWLEENGQSTAGETLDSAGLLLQDVYVMASSLVLTLAKGNKTQAEDILDAYAMNAMVGS